MVSFNGNAYQALNHFMVIDFVERATAMFPDLQNDLGMLLLNTKGPVACTEVFENMAGGRSYRHSRDSYRHSRDASDGSVSNLPARARVPRVRASRPSRPYSLEKLE